MDPKALERMHLGAPSFVRFLGGNPYPRLTVTNRPSQREADWAYGPFASRAAAERFADEALKLFLLRRCTDDLHPDPSHPGCVYSEMKMCLAPCYKGCTDERYAEEVSMPWSSSWPPGARAGWCPCARSARKPPLISNSNPPRPCMPRCRRPKPFGPWLRNWSGP